MNTATTTAERTVTAEDLRRMAEERRHELSLSHSGPVIPRAAAAGSTSEAQIVVEVRRCIHCDREFEAQGYRLFGRVLGIANECTACKARIEEEKLEAARRLDEEARERIRQDREDRILEYLRSSGVNPWAHGRCTLDGYDASESGTGPVAAVREWLDAVRTADRYEPVRGLYLFGPTGCGKTHLAVGALRELLIDPAFPADSIVFDHALSLITRIQDTYNTRESTEAILERRIRARVWILDDLGTEKPSDDVVRRLTMIFTEREGRPTLVTSNIAPDALEQRHPEFFRLVSRFGPAHFRVVQVQGRDRRFDRPRRAS